MIYAAYAIDQARDHGLLKQVLEWMHMKLDEEEVPTYWPNRAFARAMGDPEIAMQINSAALMLSGGLLAVWLEGLPTFGVPVEIDRAWQASKPIAVLTNAQSMQLSGMAESGHLRLFGVGYGDICEAVRWIGEMSREPTVSEVRWTGDPECEPQRHYSGDAGYDLIVSEDTIIRGGDYVDVPHGISVELPPEVWGLLIGRSSTLRKRRLLVTQSVIDQGYRGPLFAGCQNLNGEEVYLYRGERVAQLIPIPLAAHRLGLRRVERLSASDRGEYCFGSTGV